MEEKMKDTLVFILTGLLLISVGCKGIKNKAGKKKVPDMVKEIIELPSGERIERILFGSKQEKMKKILPTIVEGKIELVSVYPHPELLDPSTREGAYLLVIVPDKGEMIFVAGNKTTTLRKNVGKRATIFGFIRSKKVNFKGKLYPGYELTEIKKIEE